MIKKIQTIVTAEELKLAYTIYKNMIIDDILKGNMVINDTDMEEAEFRGNKLIWNKILKDKTRDFLLDDPDIVKKIINNFATMQ